MQELSANLKQYAGIFVPVAAVGGFVSDVIQPLAPLSTYVFWLSFAGTIGLVIAVLIMRQYRARLLPILIFSASFMTFSSFFLLLQESDAEAKDRGFFANQFPAIAKLQEAVGLMQQDIAEIKQTTKKTAEAVARVEESTKQTEIATNSIAESTQKIADSLEVIQQGFAGLNKSGGIINNPEKPEEHYHNARIYEQRGDYGNARRSYNAFFAFKLDFLDPHLRYQSFLKIQEGRAGAREIYASIYETDQRPLLNFARILLFDAPQRTDMIKAFLEKNPDFAPAYYELSREYSAARKGTQSLADRKAELEALERFKALHQDGKLVKFFIDQSVVSSWLEDADKRLKALAVLKRLLDKKPVTMSAMRSNSGWTVTLNFQEVPREIFYKLGDEDAFRSTGIMDVVNPATGLKMPKTYFQLKPNTAETTIEIKYTDIGNEMRGPFALPFDPASALITAHKKTLNMTINSWLSFRDFQGKTLLYFTHLISNRCAIEEVTYGIDTQATPNIFEMQPCNAKDPHNVGDGPIYIEIPGNSRFASVRLKYADGTMSETVQIDR